MLPPHLRCEQPGTGTDLQQPPGGRACPPGLACRCLPRRRCERRSSHGSATAGSATRGNRPPHPTPPWRGGRRPPPAALSGRNGEEERGAESTGGVSLGVRCAPAATLTRGYASPAPPVRTAGHRHGPTTATRGAGDVLPDWRAVAFRAEGATGGLATGMRSLLETGGLIL